MKRNKRGSEVVLKRIVGTGIPLEDVNDALDQALGADWCKTIAVDFDGTIAEELPLKGFSVFKAGAPIKSVIDKMKAEHAKGTYIVIHTCRTATLDHKADLPAIAFLEMWLKRHRVPYDEIWLSFGKPSAEAYWDNKAVRMPCEKT